MSSVPQKSRKRAIQHAAHPERPIRKRNKVQDHIGAPFWALGTQVNYIRSFLGEWMDTTPRSKARTAVVNKATILFVYKYGWDWASGDKPDAEDPDPTKLLEADQAINPEGELVTQRAQEFKDLQKVGFVLLARRADCLPLLPAHRRLASSPIYQSGQAVNIKPPRTESTAPGGTASSS